MNQSKLNINISLQSFGSVKCDSEWGQIDQPTYHRIYYVYSGDAVCTINGTKHALQSGYLYMFPTNLTYQLSHNPKEPLTCMFFHVHVIPLVTNGLIKIKVEEHVLLNYQIKLLEGLLEMQVDEGILLQQMDSLLLLVYKHTQFEFLNNPLVQATISLIHERFNQKLTNEIIAKKLGYNTNYFIKVFSETMGISPQKYLANYRTKRATELIIKNYSIKDVSSLVGYEDDKSFSRFFKRQTGIAPNLYKKHSNKNI